VHRAPTGGALSAVKRQGREVGHSLPSSAEVKNDEAISPSFMCLNDTVLN
jgi:hypothetical protein